ncbi:uncharacterized protein LOC135687127 [Rhopilema esculentum]|uniref:uncharacterized protein LOC135687127 n=1 Tax=Rhopilema esculentum TaxID=499914 RepID=UPI0031DCA1F5
MLGKESTSTQDLHFFKKLQSLPNLNTHLNNLLHKYHCIKHSSALISFSLWFCERYVKLLVKIGLLLLLCVPKALYKSSTVVVLDEFLCHQLDFLEKKLSPKTGTIFKNENGIEARSLKAFMLLLRIVVLWPRLTLLIAASAWRVCRGELKEDLRMLVEIFSRKKSEVRRTTTRIKCRRSTSSPYQRKRKHEEVEGKVEQYLFVDESYQSENDPDYEIGETTCEDNASVDGENTDDELNNDPQCFLCKECKEEDKESAEEAASSSEAESEADEVKGEDKQDLAANGSSEDEAEELKSPLRKVEEISSKFEDQANERKSPICQRG